MPHIFHPSRAAGLAALEAFLPQAGRRYTEQRNFDHGPDHRANISMLSPYIRHLMVTEQEVIKRILGGHRFADAEKFIQEVCWRTYWKGWPEMRPSVWERYQGDVATLPRSANYAAACAGRTGIDCFDAWTVELKETGYLHNHARMWFASLWIFTLGLPWQLGADFFYHHLIDGDAASNTLSWRWVAGLQTVGKTYLAQADNISKFTNGRFKPTAFVHSAGPPSEGPVPTLPIRATPSLPTDAVGLLLTEEDLHPESLDLGGMRVTAMAALPAVADRASAVTRFTNVALGEALARNATLSRTPSVMMETFDSNTLIAWAQANKLKVIATAYAPIGAVSDRFAILAPALASADIRLIPIRREWDSTAWPHAAKGFFAFKETIPGLIGA